MSASPWVCEKCGLEWVKRFDHCGVCGGSVVPRERLAEIEREPLDAMRELEREHAEYTGRPLRRPSTGKGERNEHSTGTKRGAITRVLLRDAVRCNLAIGGLEMSEAMKPGPEMDRAACAALGIRSLVRRELIDRDEYQSVTYFPPVSTDRTAMWLVWDALASRGWQITLTRERLEGTYDATLHQYESDDSPFANKCADFEGAESAPEALCRAALAALSREAGEKGGEG